MTVSFKTIDLSRDANVAVEFRRDSYVCSFGSDDAFGAADDYLGWLRDRIARQPLGHVHVWHGPKIIGQLEMAIRETSPITGYVNLFYLALEVRGQGFGEALHTYFLQFMGAGGACSARLSVSPTNTRAVVYYRKHGWRDLGPRPDSSEVNLMELDLTHVPGCT
jgi:ribosomal protein S18 acetylase RimI-like enzyme